MKRINLKTTHSFCLVFLTIMRAISKPKIKQIRRLNFMSACIMILTTCLINQALAEPVSVTDAAGQTIRLEKPPERIVVVGNAPFVPIHMLYMFPEMKGRLVGYEKKVKVGEVFLPLIDPLYKNKRPLSQNPGVEEIASLKPDLVVTKGTAKGYLAGSLALTGIPVLHLGAENPELFLTDIRNIGTLLNNRQRSQEIIDFYQKRLDSIKKGVQNRKNKKRPDVLVLEYSNRGGTTAVCVPARSWIQTIQATMAGGNPVWTDSLNIQNGWQITGFEQIAQWNPDKIYLIVWYRLNGKDVLQKLKEDKKWQLLKAVSSKQIFQFPQDIYGWDSPDPRWILGMMWMAKQTYPEMFKDLEIKTEVRLFFSTLFGLDAKTIETHIMPKVIIDETD